MSRLLITGAGGCIGHALVRSLAQSEYQLTALVLNDTEAERVAGVRNVKVVYGDICDRKHMEEVFGKGRFNVVVHLAGVVHQPTAAEEDYRKVNYQGTVDLFELSKRHGVGQFVFMSTIAVYGETGHDCVNEETPTRPESPYAVSKLMSEAYIKEHHDGVIGYTIIRATTVYGQYDKGNINKLFNLAKKRLIPVVGTGNNLKSLVFVENLVYGIALTIGNTDAYNQLFIISDEAPYPLNRILDEMGSLVGRRIYRIHLPAEAVLVCVKFVNQVLGALLKRELINTPSVAKMAATNNVDIAKAKRILKYLPKYTLAEGLRKTYAE